MPVVSLYRFACPSCGHTLKAPASRANSPGLCPSCRAAFTLPPLALPLTSWTATQVRGIVSHKDHTIDDVTLDRVALLLAQGTCMEFTMVREQLPEALSARQWRHILVLAASREIIRLDIARKIHQPDPSDTLHINDDHTDAAHAGAWTLLSRYLHFTRHDMCDECRCDRTGLSCVYQSFERFTECSAWDRTPITNWRNACEQVLGLTIHNPERK